MYIFQNTPPPGGEKGKKAMGKKKKKQKKKKGERGKGEKRKIRKREKEETRKKGGKICPKKFLFKLNKGEKFGICHFFPHQALEMAKGEKWRKQRGKKGWKRGK